MHNHNTSRDEGTVSTVVANLVALFLLVDVLKQAHRM